MWVVWVVWCVLWLGVGDVWMRLWVRGVGGVVGVGWGVRCIARVSHMLMFLCFVQVGLFGWCWRAPTLHRRLLRKWTISPSQGHKARIVCHHRETAMRGATATSAAALRGRGLSAAPTVWCLVSVDGVW